MISRITYQYIRNMFSIMIQGPEEFLQAFPHISTATLMLSSRVTGIA